jgi:hypothetical protein
MRVTFLKAATALAIVSITVARCGGPDSPTEPTPVCSIAIAPGENTFGSDGGNASLTVTAALGCAWTTSTNVDWIAITSGNAGSGNGTVAYSVHVNSGTQSRNGLVSIGGRSHAVSQDGRPLVVCSYDLAPDSAALGNEGGAQRFEVKAPADCAWSATSDAAWIRVTSGDTGSGGGTVSLLVAPNNDVADRTGTVTVVDRKFTIRQTGEVAACRYSVTPVEFSPCMPAGTVVANLTTEASCPWTATVDSSWIGLSGLTSGRGSTTIAIAYGDNYDAPRHGIVMVRWPAPTAGQNIHLSQAGCVYAVSRATFSFGSAGGPGTFDVIQQSDPYTCGGATQDRCVWTAQSTVPWITVTSSMPRQGDNPVAFVVGANTGDVRTGTITVRDKVITITQSSGR